MAFKFTRSRKEPMSEINAVSYTHLRAHETRHDLVCRLLLEKKKQEQILPRELVLFWKTALKSKCQK